MQRWMGGAAAEFLLAIATNSPRLCATDLETVFDVKSGGVAMIEFLQAV